MERIAQYVLDEDFPAKNVSFCTVDSLQAVPAKIEALNNHFVLFLAVAASEIADEVIRSVAALLLNRGMAYVCIWGLDAERVEEVIDEVIVQRNPDETEADVVITTCPGKESLEEAVWFFLNCAWPASGYEKTCEDWIAAVINNPNWSERVRAELSSPHSD